MECAKHEGAQVTYDDSRDECPVCADGSRAEKLKAAAYQIGQAVIDMHVIAIEAGGQGVAISIAAPKGQPPPAVDADRMTPVVNGFRAGMCTAETILKPQAKRVLGVAGRLVTQ